MQEKKNTNKLRMYIVTTDNTGKMSEKNPQPRNTTEALNYKKKGTGLLKLSSPTASPQSATCQEETRFALTFS